MEYSESQTREKVRSFGPERMIQAANSAKKNALGAATSFEVLGLWNPSVLDGLRYCIFYNTIYNMFLVSVVSQVSKWLI